MYFIVSWGEGGGREEDKGGGGKRGREEGEGGRGGEGGVEREEGGKRVGEKGRRREEGEGGGEGGERKRKGRMMGREKEERAAYTPLFMSWSLCSEGGEESKGRGGEECNSKRKNDGRGSGGKGIVFFPLPSFYHFLFRFVRRNTLEMWQSCVWDCCGLRIPFSRLSGTLCTMYSKTSLIRAA